MRARLTKNASACPRRRGPYVELAMRVLLQRVSRGCVTVDDKVVGRVQTGYVLLVGVGKDDSEADADRLAKKIVGLRLFGSEQGGSRSHFDRSLLDIGGGVLVVSQFTLYGDARKGRRPSFTGAAAPQIAAPLCEYFAQQLRKLGVPDVAVGQFGAAMNVEIHNDGPVTIWLASEDWNQTQGREGTKGASQCGSQ